MQLFEPALRISTIFTSQESTVDSFTEQMVNVIFKVLNEAALLIICYSRPPKNETKWLSEEDREAIRKRRRRLEKKFK